MRNLHLSALAIALAGGLAMNTAAAADRGVFLGAEWGGSQVDVEVDGLGSDSDDDHSIILRGGYYFTPNFAVEAFHADLYDYSEEGFSGEFHGTGIGLVARRNFGADGNGFYVQGRAGLFRGKVDLSEEGVGSASDSSSDAYFGVGLGYDFNDRFGLGLNYTRYQADFSGVSVDSNTLSAGVEFRF